MKLTVVKENSPELIKVVSDYILTKQMVSGWDFTLQMRYGIKVTSTIHKNKLISNYWISLQVSFTNIRIFTTIFSNSLFYHFLI